jgi:rod shape-determining protein MreC
MLTPERRDRALPTLITLLVVGILLMTFDVRTNGEGVVAALRSGTQTLVSPIQQAASTVVNPIADMIDSLSNVTSLREQNAALQAELAEKQAELVAVQDQLARLQLLESIYGLELDEADIGRTVANVIGRPDAFDDGIIIDKGTSDGIAVGQPVVDTNGYVVGRVKSVGPGNATVVPITVSRSGLAVLVGSQLGSLVPQLFSDEMRLDILEAKDPVLEGQRVVTSSASAAYPAGLAVGEVIEDASPQNGVLTAQVHPFVEPDVLRLVIVLAWPPDPITVTTDTTVPGTSTTTTTPGSSTSTPAGDG